MPTTPPEEEETPPQGLKARLRALPRGARSAALYGGALLFGVLIMPLLVWVGGNRVLGPYTHGQNAHAGAFALLEDFLTGLMHGSAVFWGVALGPVVLIVLLRLFVRGLRAIPPARRS